MRIKRTYREILSPVSVTPSLTLSPVDLEESGVIFSWASVWGVSEVGVRMVGRWEGNELSEKSLRPASAIMFGLCGLCLVLCVS